MNTLQKTPTKSSPYSESACSKHQQISVHLAADASCRELIAANLYHGSRQGV